MQAWPELDEKEKIDRIRLSMTKGIGPVSFQALIEEHENARTALDHIEAKGKTVSEPTEINALLSKNRKHAVHTLIWGDKSYPKLLAETPDAPPVLFAKGNIGLLNTPTIAIVGARNASAAGIKLTAKLASPLGEVGYMICSGLARGIDTAAHKTSLDTGTIACVAGGLDVPYPPENEDLFNKITKQGVIISELPLGVKPQARHFPRRNRLIAGLSLGVIVIEAAKKSGSLITARLAGDYGRDVFAVPGSPLDPRSFGTNQLIRQGAILTRDANDVFENLPALKDDTTRNRELTSESADSDIQERIPTPDNSNKSVLPLLSPDPNSIDDVIRLSGRDAGEVHAEILALELDGKIIKHTGGRISLAP
jgi:DNA processing protein